MRKAAISINPTITLYIQRLEYTAQSPFSNNYLWNIHTVHEQNKKLKESQHTSLHIILFLMQYTAMFNK